MLLPGSCASVNHCMMCHSGVGDQRMEVWLPHRSLPTTAVLFLSNKRMNPASPPVIHTVLPTEILVMIFEEHAKLEGRAPAIDGRVCRLWRQIVLNIPQVWAYLEICLANRPSISSLRLWLDRSHTAPLHIRVDSNFIFDHGTTFYDLLCDYHTRIASLRMGMGLLSFFAERHFPSMRLLHVKSWYWRRPSLPPVQLGPMPALQSLHLGTTDALVRPLDRLPPLKTLILRATKCTSLSKSSPSLVALILHSVSLGDAISGSLDFPSLTHLALFGVRGLKPNIKAPHLVTYHESGCTLTESFSAPVPSLVEYGVCGTNSRRPDPTEWHRSFPNIERLAIAADPSVLLALLVSLSGHPQSLPALQVISASSARKWGENISREAKKTMKSLITPRSRVLHRGIALRFEPVRQLHLPVPSAYLGHCPIRRFVIF
jgi:hypothetical protein